MADRSLAPETVDLIVGFDSAWTARNHGAIVAVLKQRDGIVAELGEPQRADFARAELAISEWQKTHSPRWTTILVDQPTIVQNPAGQRPVENIVCSSVSLRRGGMQPANTSRTDMFGATAPIWGFLRRHGGAWEPKSSLPTRVVETYPVLALISLGWTLQDPRATGRLPKYNPERRKTFSYTEWRYVASQVRDALATFGLTGLAGWADRQVKNESPKKRDQDCVDACICLLVALALHGERDCLMVGDPTSGYIVVHDSTELRGELSERCRATNRIPSDWIRVIRM